MIIERTKNAKRNIVFGMLLKIYQTAIPFLMRTVMIYTLGVNYLGLNSLFASILQVLNLAELGIGSAMVFSMYESIAKNDTCTICALMNLYKKYYRIIGALILTIGILIMPFIPKLIKSQVPNDINIYIIYLLNLVITVLSYWLFSYKHSILYAHQRVDISSKILLITDTLTYVFQYAVLMLFHNYYFYLIVMIITQVINNIVTAYCAQRMYPEYVAKGKLETKTIEDINHRIKDLFTSKLGFVIVNSVDSIVISKFLGLTVLAIYQNYFYIITAIIGFVNIIFSSCTAGVGNSIILEKEEKNYNDLELFTFIISWIAGFCTVCFLCLFQPFMKIWVGEKLMLDFSVVILFCIYFFVYEINQLLNLYKDASGMWHEDRFRPLVTAIVNLVLNLLMVKVLGIYGIILSTVVSTLMVGMPWLLYNLFTVLFNKRNLILYVKHIFSYICIVILSCIVTFFVCSFFSFGDITTLLVRMFFCCIIPNFIYLVVYHKNNYFKRSVTLLREMTNKKVGMIEKSMKKK